MKLNATEIMFGLSAALDAVEGELIGATTYHGQRVAYMSSLMGRLLGMSDYERLAMSVAAVLHDNGLTEYASGEAQAQGFGGYTKIEMLNMGDHCTVGERNVSCLPIYEDIKNVILYHHEQADGGGPFGRTSENTPLMAKIIHMADRADVFMNFRHVDEEKYQRLLKHIEKYSGSQYDEGVAAAFLEAIDYNVLKKMEDSGVVALLYQEVPTYEKEYSKDDLVKISDMFSRIIDFKSPFTTRHSRGIAEKAKIMGEFYDLDETTCNKLYFAGSVHDVGKLFVNNDILEKNGKLTSFEYDQIKNHAAGTYAVLNGIKGIEDITSWASLHHEKLDGSGYPFGKTADELGKLERLMACLDIYQALVEARPYKDGMPHEKAIGILTDLVEKGMLDGQITQDIDKRFKYWVESA